MNGSLVFDEDLAIRPAYIYTREINAEMEAKIDKSKFVLDARKRREILSILTFRWDVSAGDEAPAFDLRTTDGQELRLADLRGRIAVFMFAAMTCPPAREQVPRWDALQKKYDPSQVKLFLIYSRERHPGEPGYPDFHYTQTDQEKMDYARMLADLTNLTVAVDSIDEKALGLYGNVPNSAYVVDRSGRIVFRATWADSRKIEKVVEVLLAHDTKAGVSRQPASH
ncbi:MAG: TlpA family protein disulfide reductase [Myxococcota bacterium]